VVDRGEGVREAGAGGVEVVRRRGLDAELGRDPAGHVRAAVHRGAGGHRDQVDVGGGEAGAGQRLLGRGRGHVRHRLVSRYPAFDDPDPGADPLVAGVHDLRQVVVGEYAGGLVMAERDDAGSGGCHGFPPMRASGWPGATGSSWWASHSASVPAPWAVTSTGPCRVTTCPMTCPARTSSPSVNSAAGANVPAAPATATRNCSVGS